MKNKESILIKPASDNELEDIQQLAYVIWPAYYSSIISLDQIEYMLRNLYSLESLKEQKRSGTQFFLALERNRKVGFLALTPAKTGAIHIDKLYLLPECRGKGYGKQMVNFAHQVAQQQKATKITLNVNRFNESLWFYRGIGFSVEKEVDIPFGPYVLTDFIMQSPLAS